MADVCMKFHQPKKPWSLRNRAKTALKTHRLNIADGDSANTKYNANAGR